MKVVNHSHTATLALTAARPAELAHATGAGNEISRSGHRRQVIDNAGALCISQQPFGAAQIPGSSATVISMREILIHWISAVESLVVGPSRICANFAALLFLSIR